MKFTPEDIEAAFTLLNSQRNRRPFSAAVANRVIQGYFPNLPLKVERIIARAKDEDITQKSLEDLFKYDFEDVPDWRDVFLASLFSFKRSRMKKLIFH